MSNSPTEDSGHLVRFNITSDGSPVGDQLRVLSISVHTAINRIPWAEIVMLDGNMPDQTFPTSDGDSFKPGAEIAIEAGYGDELQTVFSGIVIRMGLRIGGHNDSKLVVECRDKAVKATIGRKNANYVDMTDSDILEKILGAYGGVSSEVATTTTTHKELVQHYCTDWDFLVSRAESNGMIVLTEQNKVTVQAPQTSAEAVLTVEYGGDLMEFKADVDSRTQLTSVKAVTWNPATQAIVEQTADSPTLNAQGDLTASELAEVAGPAIFRLQTPASLQETEVKAWAAGQQLKAGLARIRGYMRFQGDALAKVGGLITVKGVGNRFSGNVFVCAVQHEIQEGNWITRVDFGSEPQWFADRRDLTAPPASGLLPGIAGLHLGVVMKLDADPAGERRVQVSVPLLQADSDGVWARLSNFYASNGVGDFFIPEIGDEVVLGYLNEDPSHPVILGSLYSSSRTPPYDLTAENNTKAIVTRSKLRILFDEDKKVITLITPAANQIVISDDAKSITLLDQTANKVQLSPDGILLDSPKDIVISAKGKITMSAVGDISQTAQADVKVSGLNVSNTAQVGFKATGSATAELSASGQTVVKGAIVMIN
jgi:Rhs element Vgr protein